MNNLVLSPMSSRKEMEMLTLFLLLMVLMLVIQGQRCDRRDLRRE